MPVPADNVVDMTDSLPPPTGGATAPKGGEGAKKRKAKAEKPFDFARLNTLMADMVLIYGTLTAWDDQQRRIVAVNALRLAYGSDYVKAWLNSEGRRMVNPEHIVFEPGRDLEDPFINLFNGFAMQPQAGDCAPILELLRYLCSESDETAEGVASVMAWALRWMALPLQRPGTKMRSAMVFHGPQGAGKNLLFEILAKIYGQYALVVGQEQLEDKFNDWASQKLFLIGDEVVARQELYHQKNKLKAFITGETIQINTKMMPLRTESNHVNVVFLSNEQQPLALEVGDRRYFVVYTPPRDEHGLYQRVAECLANGGAQAFMQYLLALDMGKFSEYDIPPMTRAKADLIELGLKPHERFARDWMRGYLPLPLRVCSTEQLYRAFSRWSRNTGERFPPPQVTFSKGVEKVLRGKVRCKGVKLDTPVNGRAWLRMWLPGQVQAPEGMTEGAWARSCVESFEDDLRDFAGSDGAPT
jgi:putative DNA primase/helicase